MQERVPEGVRGSVGGTQQSLNAIFCTVPYVLGIAFPRPDQFSIFIVLGFSSVLSATMLYAFGLYLPSRHQLPFPSKPVYAFLGDEHMWFDFSSSLPSP